MNAIDNWNWIPNKSVGPLILHAPIPSDLLLLKLIYKLEPDIEGATWDSYEMIDKWVRFSVENCVVDSVEIWDEVFYNGINMVGITIKQLESLIQEQLIEKDIHESLKCKQFDCEELGLTAWEENGIIDSLTFFVSDTVGSSR